MSNPHPSCALALALLLLLALATFAPVPNANAGPLRKAAAGMRAAGRFASRVLPGHARRVERRQSRAIGTEYPPTSTDTAPTPQPIGTFGPPTRPTANAATNPKPIGRTPTLPACPTGTCPWNRPPPRPDR